VVGVDVVVTMFRVAEADVHVAVADRLGAGVIAVTQANAIGVLQIRYGGVDIHIHFLEHLHHDFNANHYRAGAAADGG
jgi:hypothetical protein